MTNPTLRLLYCVLGLLFATSLTAQTGYYIQGRATSSNIRFIRQPSADSHYICVVKNSKGVRTLTPDDISEYQIAGTNKFVSTVLESGESVFLEVLEEGKLSLLQYVDRAFVQHVFVKPENGEPVELVNKGGRRRNGFKAQIRSMWTNCPDLQKHIDKATYKVSSLRYIVTAHNSCEFTEIPTRKFTVGVGIGYASVLQSNARNATSAVPIGILRAIDYLPKLSYQIGAQFAQPIDASTTYFFYGLSLRYVDLVDRFVTFRSFFEAGSRILDVSLDLGLEHVVDREGLKPFLQFGISPSYSVINDVDLNAELLLDNGNVVSVRTDTGTTPFGIRSLVAAGLIIPHKDEREFRVALAFDYRFSLGPDRLFNIIGPELKVGYTL